MRYFIVFFAFFMFSCLTTKHSPESIMLSKGQVYHQQVKFFSDVPDELLSDIGRMGIDTCQILNEYEGNFFAFIFKVNPQICLTGKRVAFLNAGYPQNKMDYFIDTKERYNQGSTIIGSSTLYFFDDKQKDECGYDVAILYWSKVAIPIDKVIERLKVRR